MWGLFVSFGLCIMWTFFCEDYLRVLVFVVYSFSLWITCQLCFYVCIFLCGSLVSFCVCVVCQCLCLCEFLRVSF